MARRKFMDDSVFDSWRSVGERENPTEWKAWYEWRKYALNCRAKAQYFTVPSPMPPQTQAEANVYVATLREVRQEIGWSNGRAVLPDLPKPYR